MDLKSAYAVSWCFVLALTIILRLTLTEAVRIEQHPRVARPSAELETFNPNGMRIRLVATTIDSQADLTDADLAGKPSTLLLVSPGNWSSEAPESLAKLIRYSWRHSYGRLFIICRGDFGLYLPTLTRSAELATARPIIAHTADETLYEWFPNRDGVTIVNLDSDACVLAFAETHIT